MVRHEKVLHEITPVMESNILYIVDRKTKVFDFPLHTHEVCELNFIERAPGALRIVGDSREEITDMDLVLIANGQLEHIWEKNNYRGNTAREVTIQFDIDFQENEFFQARPFDSIREMMAKARRGLAFPRQAIQEVYSLLDQIGNYTEGFFAVNDLMKILYLLSKCPDARQLASPQYTSDPAMEGNEKINRIRLYLHDHYREDITLSQMADMAAMSISSFGRFFKQMTGRTLSEYLIYMRLTYATNQLIDSNRTIAEICTASGFNNMSHFNRLFKRNKGCSPTQFRETYRRRMEFDEGSPVKKF